jgi:hypothetical protein
MCQALTTLSVCFKTSDVKIDATGLSDAINDFWENNPAVKAVQLAQSGHARPPQGLSSTISGCVQDAIAYDPAFDDGFCLCPFSTPRQSKMRWIK